MFIYTNYYNFMYINGGGYGYLFISVSLAIYLIIIYLTNPYKIRG